MPGIYHHAGCCCCNFPISCPCDLSEWSTMQGGGATCGGFVRVYEINGYLDGDLVACVACDSSLDPAWDGTFPAHPTRCFWIETDAAISIDGKEIITPSIIKTSSKWSISIGCRIGGSGDNIWVGEKECGATPAGVYTRTSGCDATTDLEIVEA